MASPPHHATPPTAAPSSQAATTTPPPPPFSCARPTSSTEFLRPRHPNLPPHNVASMGHSRPSPVSPLAAAVLAVAIAVTVASPAAGGSSFFPGPVGSIRWSVEEALRSSRSGVKTVPGTRNLLPSCYLGDCCVTLCRQSRTVARIMSWGTAADGSLRANVPVSRSSCPLSFGTMAVNEVPSDRLRGDLVSFGSRILYTTVDDLMTLPSCTGGYQWVTGTAVARRELRWVPISGGGNNQGGGGDDGGGATGGGGRPPAGPTTAKQVAHSGCVRACAPGLAAQAPATPLCVGPWQRKQIRYATCVAGCTPRLK